VRERTGARRPTAAVALAIVALASLGACAARGADLDADAPRELVVGSDLDNRPFAWVDAGGRPRGRDVEMMERLASALGRGLVWRRMPFDALLDAAEAGRVDLVCATLGITPERAERVRFTRPYFETAQRVVVRAGPGEPRSLDELAGRRVAASAGTTSERALRTALPRAESVLGGGKELPARERLAHGEVDAVVLDGPNAEALVAGSGGELALLEEPVARERYALALPRTGAELAARLDRALTELERAGELAELDRRFGLR